MGGLKFALVLICGLIVLVESKGVSSKMEEISKLIRNFEKINKYLEKNIESNDVELIVAEAERKQKKLGFLESRSLVEAYKIFLGLSEMVIRRNCSLQATLNLRYIDIGVDDSHLAPNHELRPIDLVAQHYANRFIQTCYLGPYRKTKFIFKENHYLQVNQLLADSGATSEVEPNMAKIAELFESYKKDNENGAITDVLRRILALKETLTKDSCGDITAFNIILKNNLGISENDYWKVGRVERIVDHYTKEHAKLCKSFYPTRIDSMMKQMDTSLFETLLTISTSFFDARQVLKDFDKNTIGTYDQLKSKLLEPKNLEAMNDHKEWTYLSTDGTDLKAIDYHDILRDLSKSELAKGNGELKADRVAELFYKNLLEPCQRLIRNGGNLYKKFYYDSKNLGHYFGDSEDEFKPWVGVYFFTPAYRACKEVDTFPKLTIDRIINSKQPKAALLYPFGYITTRNNIN